MLTYTCVILVLRPKSKTQAHFCVAYTFHTEPEWTVTQNSSVCVLIAICHVRADGEFSSWDIMLVFKRLQIGGHLRFHAFRYEMLCVGTSLWEAGEKSAGSLKIFGSSWAKIKISDRKWEGTFSPELRLHITNGSQGGHYITQLSDGVPVENATVNSAGIKNPPRMVQK